MTLSVTKFLRCTIYHRKMDAAGHFIFKTLYHSVIQGSVAYLIKDNVLKDLCGKTLGILSFYSATKNREYLMGKYVFERHFDGDDQKNAILEPLINCHDPGRFVSRGPNTFSGSFNNDEQFSIDVSFNIFYIKAKSRLLACLSRMHFCGMAAGFLSCCWIFIPLHSVNNKRSKILILLDSKMQMYFKKFT